MIKENDTSRIAVAALFDGDYHLGLACLANSLYRAGFRGRIWAGYRGKLPAWAKPQESVSGWDRFLFASECEIRFVRVGFQGHLTNHKPEFLLRVLGELDPEASGIAYCDTDLLVKCPWRFVERWLDCGVAVVMDMTDKQMPPNHPIRSYWREAAGALGLETREVSGYFNGGFVGLARRHRRLLEIWRDLLAHIPSSANVDLNLLTYKDRTRPFSAPDQDALNAAIMASDVPISPVGPAGMDFEPAGYLLSHAAAGPKPWHKRYLREALSGRRPSQMDKLFWQYAEGPIAPWPPTVLRRRRLQIRLAAALGRIYGRSS